MLLRRCLRRAAAAALLAALWVVTPAAAGGGAACAGSLVAGNSGALDRIAFAVDGAESSHGADPGMWRADADGPQGPMQVSAAAAADVGGGDRFDTTENRMLGRAYLDRLYRRYASWTDAVAAYNWGPGNMDAWIAAGRPIDKFPISVALYRIRVLYGPAAVLGGRAVRFGIVHPPPRRPLADIRHPSQQSRAVTHLYAALMAASAPAAR